jgi:hypothetical protein
MTGSHVVTLDGAMMGTSNLCLREPLCLHRPRVNVKECCQLSHSHTQVSRLAPRLATA